MGKKVHLYKVERVAMSQYVSKCNRRGCIRKENEVSL